MREPFEFERPDMDALTIDLMLHGNAFVHVANVDGKLKGRRLDPSEVNLKPPAKKP